MREMMRILALVGLLIAIGNYVYGFSLKVDTAFQQTTQELIFIHGTLGLILAVLAASAAQRTQRWNLEDKRAEERKKAEAGEAASPRPAA
jgi:hypothetical protein